MYNAQAGFGPNMRSNFKVLRVKNPLWLLVLLPLILVALVLLAVFIVGSTLLMPRRTRVPRKKAEPEISHPAATVAPRSAIDKSAVIDADYRDIP